MARQVKRVIFAGPWWHEDLMQGVARHSAAQGWHLNLEPALSGHLPDDWAGDGILTTLGGDRGSFERFWRKAGCPAVSLSLNHPQLPIPRVGFDNEAAGRLAAEHFLERGFRSFAFYDPALQHVGRLRQTAFAQAVAEVDGTEFVMIETAPALTSEASGQWSARQAALQSALKRVAKPVGVLASDDSSGVEVIEACQSLGLDIPHDVGVLGMLDMPLFRQSTTVRMSSITVDFDTNTRAACELLASMMDGAAPPAEPILFPPTGIATRHSTDVIAARHPGVARAVRFMMERYARPIGVQQIVNASGMSQTRLFAAFKQDIGQTPAAVLTRVRIEKAKRHLRRNNDTLETVATDCGFSSRINLYRQFKRHVGISPGQFRKQSRAD